MKEDVVRTIEAKGFVCDSCNTFWRDDKVKREICPLCKVPRRVCTEVVLVLGEERVDAFQPAPSTGTCGGCKPA